jgi:hypothetical protein
VVRRTCSCKREEVTGGWRKLYNEELHNLYSSNTKSDKIEVDEVDRESCMHGREVYTKFVGKV